LHRLACLRIAPLFLLLIGASSPIYRYALEEAGSNVRAKVSFFGLASKTAQFPRVSGRISLTPDDLNAIDLDVTVDARALVSSDTTTTGRLKGPKFFDVENHPIVRFAGRRMVMTGAQSATLAGEITARGVTRPAQLAVNFAQPPARANGREPITLTAQTTIDRREFGMTSYSVIVGRKVTITITARMVPG
jgi:polyisoprenoid-binding protein YceI